jgi:hypothetical protein
MRRCDFFLCLAKETDFVWFLMEGGKGEGCERYAASAEPSSSDQEREI